MIIEESRNRQQAAATEARLATLERQARHLRRAVGAMGILLVAAIAVAGTRPSPDRVTAQQFTLLDANRNECAVWSSAVPVGKTFGSAYMTFRRPDNEGGSAVSLDAGAGNPFLLLQGRSWSPEYGRGEASVSLKVDVADGPQLSVGTHQYAPSAKPSEFTSLQTVIGVPYAEGIKCCFAKRGNTEVWSAP